jgi:ribosomal protein L31E
MKKQNLHVADVVVSEFVNHYIWTQGMSENGKNLRTHQNLKIFVNLGHPNA